MEVYIKTTKGYTSDSYYKRSREELIYLMVKK